MKNKLFIFIPLMAFLNYLAMTPLFYFSVTVSQRFSLSDTNAGILYLCVGIGAVLAGVVYASIGKSMQRLGWLNGIISILFLYSIFFIYLPFL